MELKKEIFGQKDGHPVTLYTFKNNNGFEVSCIDYGCVITKIISPDRNGKMENVVLGFDTVEEYEANPHYLGAVAGRFAGRIKEGSFELEGENYQLAKNSNGQHLHGGEKGFNAVLWNSKTIENDNEAAVEFTYLSKDGEEGYPGNLEMTVRYTIKNDSNDLVISYSAKSDKTTIVNVTNHSYFNLSGDLKRDILDHELTLNSNQYLELNTDLLPTGELVQVDESIFDFRNGRTIREAAHSDHPQNVLAGNGYDHPFLLNKTGGNEIVLSDHESGRQLVVETTEPALVLYTGNGVGGPYSIRGTEARDYLGLCLETQGPPDSVNHPHFQSSVLKAGETFTSQTKFSFGLIKN